MKRKKLFLSTMLVCMLALSACADSSDSTESQAVSETADTQSDTPAVIEAVHYELPTSAEDWDVYVEPIDGISDDFIRGVDASEVLSLENSGVTYYNYEGEEADVFETMAQSGVNYIRLRIWNDPYDEDGNGYGGGNCDLDTAIALGTRATQYGMKLLIDFHYSDFWADPSRQLCPKAWADMSVDEKCDALYDFTYDSLEQLIMAGVDVGIVQVGNETNNGMAGEDSSTAVAKLQSSGSKAVRDISSAYGKDIKVAVHYTNATNYDGIDGIAKILENNNVDYDIFAISYYGYWHGTTDKVAEVMKHIKEDYDKEVLMVEFSYPYTDEDGDCYGNSVEGGEAVSGYTSSVQSQSTFIRDMCKLAYDSDAIGVCYWGGAWVPVGDEYESNRQLWESCGSGWASSYASDYDPENVGSYYGGSAWDNQALFDFTGHPLASLATFRYLAYGTNCEESIDYIPPYEVNVLVGKEIELPDSIPVITNTRREDATTEVTWDEEDIAAIDNSKEGEYTVNGVTSDGTAVSATVTIGYVNLVLNPSFEEDDYSMWSVESSGSDPTDFQNNEADAYTGDVAFHFWDTSDMDFEITQTFTDLEPGTYMISVYSQGGDMDDTCELTLFALVDGQEYSTDFMDTSWAEWQHPVVTDIPVTNGEITIGVRMKTKAQSWGTLDDFALCKID